MVNAGQVGLRVQYGTIQQKLPPGMHTLNRCVDSIHTVDIRAFVVDAPLQTLITADGVMVQVNGFAVCRVVNPEVYYFLAENPKALLKIYLLTELANIVSKLELDDFMNNREQWEADCLNKLNRFAFGIGLVYELVGIQDMQINPTLRQMMGQNALAKQQSISKVIIAEGEMNSAKMFKEAADAYSKNKISLQLQYKELLKEVSRGKPTKVLLPDNILGGWDKIMAMKQG